jgi:hypothetical protein
MPEVKDSSSSCLPGTAAVTASPGGLDFLCDKAAVLTNAIKDEPCNAICCYSQSDLFHLNGPIHTAKYRSRQRW